MPFEWVTKEQLEAAWRDAIRAAELVERMAREAIDAASQARLRADALEEVATLAERTAALAQRAAEKAREAADGAAKAARELRRTGVDGDEEDSTSN